MVMDALFRSAQLALLLSGYLVVARCGLTLSLDAPVLLSHLLGMLLRLLGVLLGESAVLGRLAAMRIDRAPQLLGLRDVSIRFLTVTSRFGGKPLS
jgi:hypothetical protein